MTRPAVVVLRGAPIWGLVFAGAMLAPPPAAAQPADSPRPLTIREEVVAGPGRLVFPPTLLPDGRRIIWRIVEKGQWTLVVDGRSIGDPSDMVSPDILSANGRHSALAIRRGDSADVVVDGELRGRIPYRIGKTSFQFAPPPIVVSDDGRTVAFSTIPLNGKDLRASVGFVGESLGPQVDVLGQVAVGAGSPPRLAYAAFKGGKYFVVADGAVYDGPSTEILKTFKVKLETHELLKNLTFGPDGKRFAFLSFAADAGKFTDGSQFAMFSAFAVVDGKADNVSGMGFGPVLFSQFIFSPDGTRIAYATVSAGRSESFSFFGGKTTIRTRGRVVVDGAPGPAFEYSGPPLVNGLVENGTRPIVSKLLSPWWGGVSIPAFSPDSRHIAYVARTGNREFSVIVDGTPQPLPPVDRILRGPVYSPDGQHAVCVGANESEVIVFVDGKELTKTAVRGIDLALDLTFSADGRHVAFVSERLYGTAAYHRVIVDGTAGKEFESFPVEALLFSPDGRHTAYILRQGGLLGKSRVVLDGIEGNKYGFGAIYKHSLAFSPEGAVSFLVFDGGKVLRVTQSVD